MNTPIDSQAQENRPQINAQRRRLAKAGLATPVVIGTLLSRPVLAEAPHHCTISGQISGNASPRFGDGVACNTLGDSPTDWAGTTIWPNPFVAGKPSAGTCPGEATTGTLFKNTASLGSTFADAFRCVPITEQQTSTTTTCSEYYTNGTNAGQCKPNKSTTTTTTNTVTIGSEVVGPSDTRFATGISATLQQVLETTSTDPLFSLGRAAIASLLNATKLAPNYPLTGKQVIDMFNAVYSSGGKYDPLGINWNATQVKTFFESLYS